MVQRSFDVETRRAHLKSLLERDGSVSLSEVAQNYGVSEMTVRRDLAEMEQAGLARRVRGGAVAVGPELFERRRGTQGRAKQAIAQKLLPLLPRSGAVAFDASSTIHELALALEPSPISILSTGMETTSVLARSGKARSLISGGEVQESTGALIGPLAVHSIGQFVFTRAFVSPTRVDVAHGLTESTIEGAEIKQALRRATQSLIVAVDSTKLHEAAIAKALDLAEVDLLVTELDPSAPELDRFRDQVELL